MASNTKIILKKSGTFGNTPASLEYGELGVNYADGLLFYKNTNDVITTITTTGLRTDNVSLSTTSSNQVVDTFDKTKYRTIKYLVQAVQGSNVHCTEVVLTHNDDEVFKNEYGVMWTNQSLISVSATIGASNVSLVITPSYTNTKIDFTKTSLIARTLV